jgi:predicted transcriptional regulator of viral defense system
MAAPASKASKLLTLVGRGPLRARDLDAAGIPRAYLTRLSERGVLEHVDRGLYRLADAAATENHSMAEVGKRVPHAIICLLSALQLHEMTSELPHAVWVMIDRHARKPKVDYPRLEVVRASGDARSHGVEQWTIEGVAVHVTSPAKTVADCFRYRRHVGLDTALAALRDYLDRGRRRRPAAHPKPAPGRPRQSDYSVDALIAATKADRISSLVRPYIEALA